MRPEVWVLSLWKRTGLVLALETLAMSNLLDIAKQQAGKRGHAIPGKKQSVRSIEH